LGTDPLSRYYDSQRILAPPSTANSRPAYLVTANALVWGKAIERVGGFDERFPFAGGEDIDLAYRLRHVGHLGYAPDAVVLHDFGDGIVGFVQRFIRYGKGNRLLEVVHQSSHKPRPFLPSHRSGFNLVIALAQFALMRYGYHTLEPELLRAFEVDENRARAAR
jgi:GT2 family glycosyltransferase